MKDYYKILEVNASASSDEIKKSYRQLALKYHPDKNPNDKISESKFKEIVEAYEILGDTELRRNYDQKIKSSQQAAKPKTEEKPLTPQDILKLFTDTRKRVVKLGRKQINETGLFQSLRSLLNDNTIKFLLAYGDTKTNKLIMNEVLICCKYIDYDRAEKLISKLVEIAGSDNDTIVVLHNYSRKLKRWSIWDRYKGITAIAAIFLFIFIITLADNRNSNSTSSSNTPKNGDLNNTFVEENTKAQLTPEQQLEQKRNELLAAGWEEKNIENGQLPVCYNFKPKRGKVENYLEVYVGSGTDVSIKVMNAETEKCVRFVFINSGTTYKITNIPQGIYYLKIAYGKNWFSKIENGQCVGKFLRNPMYEKGEDIMDFNLKYTDGGYSVPSFKLELDVIESDVSNSFNSQNISEEDFNR